MIKPSFYITDVFSDCKYGGNPLATFVDCESLTDQEMQDIAKEINFSETTFIMSRKPREGAYDVRIFTPTAEVEFAGHPTLGTAYIIKEKLGCTAAEVVLNLAVGKIPVEFVERDGQLDQLWMRQITPQFGQQIEPARVAQVLGIEVAEIAADYPSEEVSTGFPTLIVPVTNLAALKRIKINRPAYDALVGDAWAKIILAFSRETYQPTQDLAVRVFGDYYGIPEDAATGSSNGSLAAYLVKHKMFGHSPIDLTVGQGYEMNRPSVLALRARLHDREISVHVGGSVVAIAQGIWG